MPAPEQTAQLNYRQWYQSTRHKARLPEPTFDMSRYKEPYVATFAGGHGWAVTVDKNDESITAPALMCHILRNTEQGLEHRTRFWMGYRISCGKPELTLPPGVFVPQEAIGGLARHNVKEFTRFRDFLPRIYAEFGGRMEV
jgi:hypothetical protein